MDVEVAVGYGPEGSPDFWIGTLPQPWVPTARSTSRSAPRDVAQVHAFHDAATALGAEVLHAPRHWPEYHPGYYGTFVRDPDGNNVEAVCHTAAHRVSPTGSRPFVRAVGEDGAVSEALPTTIPHGRTARRLEWPHLPPQSATESRSAAGRRSWTPRRRAPASRPASPRCSTCEDGSRHFVKAASRRAQRMFAEAYREEARKLAALPDARTGSAAALDHRRRRLGGARDRVRRGAGAAPAVAARRPRACLDALEQLAAVLTPPPADLASTRSRTSSPTWPAYWDNLRAPARDLAAPRRGRGPGRPLRRGRPRGETLVHTDIRDDNLLLATDGRVLLCDWNWPVVGAAWLDTVFLMIGPRGDGLDVDAVLAASPPRDVPAESIDIVIALITGYFLMSAAQPVPPTSPYIRDAQRWQGEVCWRWLARAARVVLSRSGRVWRSAWRA